ncbi:MAG: hypothetical protein WHS44_03165 [Fimbriimonadales bacterium]|nr:MAG: hypothetical protein KatS3mg018_1904 [Fimbriimonadales bacterium]
MRRPMLVLGGLVALVALASAQTVDGRNIPQEFGTPLASQTNYTGFGDRVSSDQNWGSELNQLFVRCVNGVLYIGVTGNLEGNGNSIHLYIDTGRSSSNTFNLTTGCINCSVQGMSGVLFDHNPDYAIGVNRFDDQQGNDNIYIDIHDLVNNQSTYVGAVAVGTGANTPQGGDNSANLSVAFDNANLQGVTSDPNNIGDPSTATTGLEVAIPLSALGNPQGEIKILAVLTGGANLDDPCQGTYLSNQSLPAMNIGNTSQQFGNAAWARCPDPPFDFFPFSFAELAGTHYVAVQPCPAGPEGDVNGDGCVDDADLLIVLFNFGNAGGDGDVNSDNIVDDADLLIVLFNFGTGC